MWNDGNTTPFVYYGMCLKKHDSLINLLKNNFLCLLFLCALGYVKLYLVIHGLILHKINFL